MKVYWRHNYGVKVNACVLFYMLFVHRLWLNIIDKIVRNEKIEVNVTGKRENKYFILIE